VSVWMLFVYCCWCCWFNACSVGIVNRIEKSRRRSQKEWLYFWLSIHSHLAPFIHSFHSFIPHSVSQSLDWHCCVCVSVCVQQKKRASESQARSYSSFSLFLFLFLSFFFKSRERSQSKKLKRIPIFLSFFLSFSLHSSLDALPIPSSFSLHRSTSTSEFDQMSSSRQQQHHLSPNNRISLSMWREWVWSHHQPSASSSWSWSFSSLFDNMIHLHATTNNNNNSSSTHEWDDKDMTVSDST